MKQPKSLTLPEFFKLFPDDAACLAHLFKVRYGVRTVCPKCQRESKFSRVKKIPAFQCQWCGHHIHPMAGTAFMASRTPLQKWFYAMYLFSSSRHGVSAKELQRQLGVTYKTAWRMGHEIRKHLGKVDGTPTLKGHVEADETFVGGKLYGQGVKAAKDHKAIVFGMVEREGRVTTQVVPDRKASTVQPLIHANVQEGSKLSTDEWNGYWYLWRKYKHGVVNHSEKQYVKGIHHTNTIEGFWSHLKRSLAGTHIHVSKKHLAKYLGEFEYRWNLRTRPDQMFLAMVRSF